jgi:hypothetical protein
MASASKAKFTMLRISLLVIAGVISLVIALVWINSRVQARERDKAETTDAGNLHGLASVVLPKGYRARGLSGADRTLSAEEQLLRHDQTLPLVFRFEKDPSNDWGGHPKDPELMNIVLLPPAARADLEDALRNFSIERYYSPTGKTIPLDSPRWQRGEDERYRWRVLAMEDHFGTDHQPRWAIAMLDPHRGVRIDFFVWQKRLKQDKALARVRGVLDSLQVNPALDEHFAQTGTVEERITRLREANLSAMFDALAPLDVDPPAPGETSFGRAVAVWLDEDRKATRVLRLLAAVPLPDGALKATRDKQGRPILPLVLKPDQYPGPTRDGLPSLNLQMLYWNPELDRWQRSFVQTPTMQEQYPLLPFEEVVVARLEQVPGARDTVFITLGAHWFHPPALDDTRRIKPLLEECDMWQKELLAGRIIGGEVRAVDLGQDGL